MKDPGHMCQLPVDVSDLVFYLPTADNRQPINRQQLVYRPESHKSAPKYQMSRNSASIPNIVAKLSKLPNSLLSWLLRLTLRREFVSFLRACYSGSPYSASSEGILSYRQHSCRDLSTGMLLACPLKLQMLQRTCSSISPWTQIEH